MTREFWDVITWAECCSDWSDQIEGRRDIIGKITEKKKGWRKEQRVRWFRFLVFCRREIEDGIIFEVELNWWLFDWGIEREKDEAVRWWSLVGLRGKLSGTLKIVGLRQGGELWALWLHLKLQVGLSCWASWIVLSWSCGLSSVWVYGIKTSSFSCNGMIRT